MSDTTPQRRPRGADRPARDDARAVGTTSSGTDGPAGDRRSRNGDGRRVPVWAMVAVGVLLVVAAGVVAMIMTNRGTTTEVLEPEVVTLPVPTPTVEPVERPEGTAFQQSLPATVLDLALTGIEEDPELLDEGALESYRATYGDGGDREVAVLAGQWETAEEANAVLDERVAAARAATGEGAAESEAPTTSTPDEGVVEVDGAQVGRWSLVPGDGTETVWWTNGTVMLQATGPAGTVRDVYTAFSL